MVGRLVEEQYIGFLQQDFGQLDTHTPTTRELRCGTLEITTLKAQTGERTLYLGFIVLSTHHHIALVLGSIFLNQLHVALALVIGTFSKFLIHLIQALLHTSVISKSFLCFFTNGGIVLQNHDLWQVAHLCIVRHTNSACGRFLLSTQYFEHGRFTSSIFAHKGYAVLVVNDETGAIKQGFYAKFNFQSFY